MVLKSYFDGSNQADSSEYDRISIATVCGTGKQWDRFQTAWKKVLYKHHADYLHTTDAVSLQNDFATKRGWNNTRVDSFIGDCVSVIEKQMAVPAGFRGWTPRTGLYLITLTIPFDDWIRAKKTTPELPETIEEPCATDSVSFAFKWGRYIGARKYELYFDRGEKFLGFIDDRWRHPKAKKDIEIMKDVTIVAPAIAKDVPALQMADLLAWAINRANQETREWHRRLHRLPYHSKLLDYEHLINPSLRASELRKSLEIAPSRVEYEEPQQAQEKQLNPSPVTALSP